MEWGGLGMRKNIELFMIIALFSCFMLIRYEHNKCQDDLLRAKIEIDMFRLTEGEIYYSFTTAGEDGKIANEGNVKYKLHRGERVKFTANDDETIMQVYLQRE